jgi:tetratricopeptide (TPR) repeat protein
MTAERTTDFVKGLFQVSNPSEAEGQNISAREVLDRGAREIQGELSNEPDVKAELISTLSEVYAGLGSFRRADDLIRGSLSLKVRSPETRARQLGVLGASSSLQGNYDQAQKVFGAGLRRLGPPGELTNASLYSELLTGRADALAQLDRYNEARMLTSQALAWDRMHEGERSPEFARDLELLGLTDQHAHEYDRSNRSYLRALSIRVAVQSGLHPKVSDDLNQLASNAYFQGNSAASEAYLRRALALDEKVIGPDHPDIASSLNNLARILIEGRKFREALPMLNRSVIIYLAQREGTHGDLSFIFSNRALALRGLGQDAEAEADFRRGLRAAEAHNNRAIAPILTDLADLLCAHGKAEEALQMLARAAPIMRARYPDDAWRSAWVENTRGACLLQQGDHSGGELVTASAPVLLKRWPPNTLYGFTVEQRLRRANAI